MMRDMRRGLVCRWWGPEALVDWVQWACRAYGARLSSALGTRTTENPLAVRFCCDPSTPRRKKRGALVGMTTRENSEPGKIKDSTRKTDVWGTLALNTPGAAPTALESLMRWVPSAYALG